MTCYVTTGIAILRDTSATPDYMRWAGYVEIMMGLGQTWATFLIYFKAGPFAWDAALQWLPASWFFIWFVVVTVTTTRAINAQCREATEPQLASAPA